MAGLGLFLFTSALGRVWCGYACPQTVWTDLFILVERWIEGDRNARLRLHRQAKMDFRKFRLRADQVRRLAADRPGHRRRLGILFRRCADAADAAGDRHRPSHRLYHRSAADRDHLLLRRHRARTDLHLRLSLAAHPGGDDGRGHAGRRLSRMARRAAQAFRSGQGRGGAGRLHRLHGLRERLPGGHRHPRRPAAGMHHLRALHRRLRRRSWPRSASRAG